MDTVAVVPEAPFSLSLKVLLPWDFILKVRTHKVQFMQLFYIWKNKNLKMTRLWQCFQAPVRALIDHSPVSLCPGGQWGSSGLPGLIGVEARGRHQLGQRLRWQEQTRGLHSHHTVAQLDTAGDGGQFIRKSFLYCCGGQKRLLHELKSVFIKS